MHENSNQAEILLTSMNKETGDGRALVLFKCKTRSKPAHSFVTFYILIALCLDPVWAQLLGLTRF